MVTVSSGWSSRTLILEQLGSSLVHMLIGTIQLGQSSPSTHAKYTQTMSKRKASIHASGLGTYFPSFHSTQNSNFIYSTEILQSQWKYADQCLNKQTKIAHLINPKRINLKKNNWFNTTDPTALQYYINWILPSYGPLAQNFFWDIFSTLSSPFYNIYR